MAPGPDAGPGAAESTPSLSRNVAATTIGRVVYLLSRVALPPFILHYVSLEEYGIWAYCFVLIGYLGMSAFGVTNVYIRYVAEYHARGEVERINRLVSTGLIVTGLLGVVILVGLWLVLPWIIRLFNIGPHLQDTAFVLLFATSATFVLDLSLGSFAQVLIGLQRISQQMAVWVGTSVLEAVLIVALLAGGLGIYALVVAFAVRFVVAIALYAWLCRRALPGLALRPGLFDRQCLRLFYGFGSVVQAAGLLGIFLYSIEKLIAGIFIGPAAAGLFDVGEKFPVMVSGIPSSMNAALLPAISRLNALDRAEESRALYVRASRYISTFGGLLLGYLAAFAGPVIVFWLGSAEEYRPAIFILAAFTVAFHMHVVTGPASALFRGVGEPARELVYPLTQLTLVAASVALGFAIAGRTIEVITVCVAGSMVSSAFLYEAYTNRRLGVPHWRFLRVVWLPGLVPYALAGVVAVLVTPLFPRGLTDRWHALALLAVGGILYGVLNCAVLYRFFCDESERATLADKARQVLARLVPRRAAGAGGRG